LSASATASASCTPADNVMQCFSCHGRGHYASECPHRTLALEHKPIECEDEIVEAEGSYEDLVEVKNNLLLGDSYLSVVRSLLSKPVLSDEWMRTTIFHTLIKCGDTSMNMVIDGGSTINVVAQSTIKHCNLTVEPHPHPFKVAWLDKTNLTVSHKCKVPIQIGIYKDEIICDVMPMDVAHILLGRPWLYNRNVTHHGKDNTYTFKFLRPGTSLLPFVGLNSCFLPQTQSLYRPRPHL